VTPGKLNSHLFYFELASGVLRGLFFVLFFINDEDEIIELIFDLVFILLCGY
jgi:hypothetical protein